MRLIFAAFISCVVISCNRSGEPAHLYFDSKTYFQHEISRLKQQQQTLRKELQFNDQKEVAEAGLKDFENELMAFSEIDLNKPAFAGRLKVDSNITGSTQRITYTNTDLKSELQSAAVEQNVITGKITRLDFVFHESNMIYASEKHLQYIPDSMFAISGKQQVRFADPSVYDVKMYFSKR